MTDTPAAPADTWLTRKEAAAYLKLGESTLAKMFIAGTSPPAVKIGKSVRYLRSDLDAWMLARRRTSTSDPGAVIAAIGPRS